MIGRLAPAKINLALHVVGQRQDGYHLLDTVAVFADGGDRLTASAADDLTLTITGPLAGHAPAGAANLVLRAAEALRRHTGCPSGAAIGLEKHIPAGAGFGGGSADGAAALVLLDELWETRLGAEALAQLGLSLGADVPMCLRGSALRARGIGEILDPISGWPALPILLVWPGVAVSTAMVFAALDRRENLPLPSLPGGGDVEEIAAWLAGNRNDLQDAASSASPEVRQALDGLGGTEGCLLARMSGSGSGCFGLYATEGESRAAADQLGKEHPDWWLLPTVAR